MEMYGFVFVFITFETLLEEIFGFLEKFTISQNVLNHFFKKTDQRTLHLFTSYAIFLPCSIFYILESGRIF